MGESMGESIETKHKIDLGGPSKGRPLCSSIFLVSGFDGPPTASDLSPIEIMLVLILDEDVHVDARQRRRSIVKHPLLNHHMFIYFSEISWISLGMFGGHSMTFPHFQRPIW